MKRFPATFSTPAAASVPARPDTLGHRVAFHVSWVGCVVVLALIAVGAL